MGRINLNGGYSEARMCIGTGQDIATIIRRAWVQIEK